MKVPVGLERKLVEPGRREIGFGRALQLEYLLAGGERWQRNVQPPVEPFAGLLELYNTGVGTTHVCNTFGGTDACVTAAMTYTPSSPPSAFICATNSLPRRPLDIPSNPSMKSIAGF